EQPSRLQRSGTNGARNGPSLECSTCSVHGLTVQWANLCWQGCASSTPAAEEADRAPKPVVQQKAPVVAPVPKQVDPAPAPTARPAIKVESSNGTTRSYESHSAAQVATVKAPASQQASLALSPAPKDNPVPSASQTPAAPASKSSGPKTGDKHHHDEAGGKGQKERRAAAGTEAVREQIRKLAVGGAPSKDAKDAIYAVSDSEDEELQESDLPRHTLTGWGKPQEVTDAVCEALKRNFVFKGISESLLVEVVISGAVDQQSKAQGGEERKVEGHTVRIPQRPGWVFGDVALLFHSPRTASVMAKTNIVVWALDRKTFLQFVMKHAQGARALRFLRKLPLLKGLSDNDMIRAAARMPQRVYQDGQALIKYGERGDELYLIRYGKVVVMKKKDFMDLDNPLLAWMLDYDAVSACLRQVSLLKGLKQEQMEQILDRFDARDQVSQGHVIINQGDLVEKLYVVKIGEVQLLRDGEPVTDTTFVREATGFTFFGDESLKEPFRSNYTVKVSSESLQMLSLSKRQLDSFLGRDQGLNTLEQVLAALKKSKHIGTQSDTELKAVLQSAEEVHYNAGDVVVAANGPITNKVFLVKSGEVVLVPADVPLPETGQVELGRVQERGRLLPGQLFNDEACASPATASLKASLVASTPSVLITFTTNDVEKVVGLRAVSSSGRKSMVVNVNGFKSINFADLEFHRIVGTGQFGLVRVVRNIKTNDVYALKVMHKAPITETKQIEHVINERRILEEASHPFCVQLCGAYQDRNSLYLLQVLEADALHWQWAAPSPICEWVPGGELFHHLDLEGAFDENTAMFFAASVLLALEFLHTKNIVYRDLKPENLLLDSQGYIKVADFGFAKFIGEDKTFTICGTPDYQAPEVIMRRGTTKAADYWALGVLIFEMLVGDPPFKSLTGDPWDTFRRTLSGRFYVPNFISDQAADLIFKLLQVNPDKRLGSGPAGAEDIRRHKWFSKLDWNALMQRKLQAPIRPKIRNPLDTSNFDNFDSCDVEAPPVPAARLEKHAQLWDMLHDPQTGIINLQCSHSGQALHLITQPSMAIATHTYSFCQPSALLLPPCPPRRAPHLPWPTAQAQATQQGSQPSPPGATPQALGRQGGRPRGRRGAACCPLSGAHWLLACPGHAPGEVLVCDLRLGREVQELPGAAGRQPHSQQAGQAGEEAGAGPGSGLAASSGQVLALRLVLAPEGDSEQQQQQARCRGGAAQGEEEEEEGGGPGPGCEATVGMSQQEEQEEEEEGEEEEEEEGEEGAEGSRPPGPLCCLAAPLLLAGYESGSLAVWDLRRAAAPTPSPLLALAPRLHPEPLLALALSPWSSADSSRAAANRGRGGGDRPGASPGPPSSSRLGQAGPGSEGAQLTVRQQWVLPSPGVADLAFRPDGKLLALAGWDGKVRLYSGHAPHTPLAVLRHHTREATCVAWSPHGGPAQPGGGAAGEGGAGDGLGGEGSLLASASRDASIALWQLFNQP
ncbi:hypothetical protein QJQ45_029755, partial [Haematococcus lacustris]